MKRFIPILSLVILVSCSAMAQTKHTKDSLAHNIVKDVSLNYANDSTGLLSVKDMQELSKFIEEMPAKYANPITNWLLTRLQLRAQEYATKPRH